VILGVPTEVKDIEAQLVRPTIERVQRPTAGRVGPFGPAGIARWKHEQSISFIN
jgi:hypothetical protein